MSVKITTDGKARDVVNAWELTAEERAQFDYIDWAAVDDGRDSATFARYRGELYDLGDTEGVPSQEWAAGWDLYLTDSFFSGVLFRFPREDDGEIDGERVVCATFYAS